MEAIKVTRQNLAYVQEYVVNNTPWAADLVIIMDANLAIGEWTYVYTIDRGAGESTKTYYYHMREKTFHEFFAFKTVESPYALMPITKK